MTTEERNRQQHWEAVYAGKTEDAVSWFQAAPAISLDLIDRPQTHRASKIIDVGGGASRLVDALLDRGFSQVTVLDIAAPALEMAKKRVGAKASAVTWVAADITRWEPADAYDVWHDRAVFHFLTTDHERAAYKKALRTALRPGGIAFIASFALHGPERCSGLSVQRYSPESLAKELGDGFQLIDSMGHDHETPFETVQKFQFSYFRRL